eukprot:scaffold25158_cov65-Phaeocystis_antarctica.AAC.1
MPSICVRGRADLRADGEDLDDLLQRVGHGAHLVRGRGRVRVRGSRSPAASRAWCARSSAGREGRRARRAAR